MKLSIRGERLSGESGTLRLMEDLGCPVWAAGDTCDRQSSVGVLKVRPIIPPVHPWFFNH